MRIDELESDLLATLVIITVAVVVAVCVVLASGCLKRRSVRPCAMCVTPIGESTCSCTYCAYGSPDTYSMMRPKTQ